MQGRDKTGLWRYTITQHYQKLLWCQWELDGDQHSYKLLCGSSFLGTCLVFIDDFIYFDELVDSVGDDRCIQLVKGVQKGNRSMIADDLQQLGMVSESKISFRSNKIWFFMDMFMFFQISVGIPDSPGAVYGLACSRAFSNSSLHGELVLFFLCWIGCWMCVISDNTFLSCQLFWICKVLWLSQKIYQGPFMKKNSLGFKKSEHCEKS